VHHGDMHSGPLAHQEWEAFNSICRVKGLGPFG
jgi:hypothetical protein